jgi:acyl-CoA-binding protein
MVGSEDVANTTKSEAMISFFKLVAASKKVLVFVCFLYAAQQIRRLFRAKKNHGGSKLLPEFDNDKAFSAACEAIKSAKLSTDQQLTLYAFYKQSLEGPCMIEAPSAINMVQRAKWDAWRALGKLEPSAARAKYVETVNALLNTSDKPTSLGDSVDDVNVSNSINRSGGGGMGAVMSLPVEQKHTSINEQDKTICDWAEEGNSARLTEALRGGINVNFSDEKGCTALHHAVDKNNLELVRLLVSEFHANVNCVDEEGDTPLHYAVNAENDTMMTLLMELKADPYAKNHQEEGPFAFANKALKSQAQNAGWLPFTEGTKTNNSVFAKQQGSPLKDDSLPPASSAPVAGESDIEGDNN